jgi:hypothetical protein
MITLCDIKNMSCTGHVQKAKWEKLRMKRLPGMIDNLHFCMPVKSLQLTYACMCVNTHTHFFSNLSI